MSAQHPIILYMGDRKRGSAFANWAQAHDWMVYLPQEAMETLALYITHWPDITILDANAYPDVAAEVYHHLRSIYAHPLLILTNDLQWDAEADEDVFTASPAINNYELMETIGDLLDVQPLPMF